METLRIDDMKIQIKDQAECQTVFDNQGERVERHITALEAIVDLAIKNRWNLASSVTEQV